MNISLPARALALALAGAAIAAIGASPPALAQYYDDDDNGDRRYDDRGYDSRDDDGRYDNGARSWDTQGEDDGVSDVSFFHDELSDHGRWISHREYGFVWTPKNVDSDWRPYTRGHWANTDEHGWYWVSEEPFGWATYHYGRWFLDDRNGWLWVPGTTWGPAWVAWRYSDSHVGWAPLPPDASWDARNGLRYDAATYESPSFAASWSFVEPRYISTPNVYRYCAPRHRARTIIYSTRPQTRYHWRGDRVVNLGVSVDFFSRHLGSSLGSVRIFATESRHARGYDRRAGDVIRVWRPDFRRNYHANRPHHRDRPWGNGFWRNVDRHAAHRPGAEAPRRREWNPSRTWGLPPSGRETRPAHPEREGWPGYGRGDGRPGFDRGNRDWPRGERPAERPGRPPVAETPPTPPPVAAPGWPGRGDRPGRNEGRGDGRPGFDRGNRDWPRGERPAEIPPAPPRQPPVAETPPPPPAGVAPGWPGRGDRPGRGDGRPAFDPRDRGDRPRGPRPAELPPAAAPPASPPAGPDRDPGAGRDRPRRDADGAPRQRPVAQPPTAPAAAAPPPEAPPARGPVRPANPAAEGSIPGVGAGNRPSHGSIPGLPGSR